MSNKKDMEDLFPPSDCPIDIMDGFKYSISQSNDLKGVAGELLMYVDTDNPDREGNPIYYIGTLISKDGDTIILITGNLTVATTIDRVRALKFTIPLDLTVPQFSN